MPAHSLHKDSNVTGARLLPFAAPRRMCVKTSFYPQREINKMIGNHPTEITKIKLTTY